MSKNACVSSHFFSMASSDGETCYDDDFSDLDDDENSLDGWLVQDDFVEYMDENDAYLDDEEEEQPVSCTRKKRLLRAEPETDDEDAIKPTKRKWLVLDDDDDESPAQISVA